MPPPRRTVNTSRARRPVVPDDDDNDGVNGSGETGMQASNGRRADSANDDHDSNGGNEDDDERGMGNTAATSSRVQASQGTAQIQQQVGDLLQQFEQIPHPLTREAHDHTIKSMYDDWAPRDRTIAGAMELLSNLAERRVDLSNALHAGLLGEDENDDRLQEEEEKLRALDQGFLSLIDLQEQAQRSRSVLQEIREQLVQGSVPESAALYQRSLDEKAATYHARSRRQRYGHNKQYEAYKQRVWSALHDDDQPMPPLVELIDGEGGGAQDGSGQPDTINGGGDDDEDEDIVAYGASSAQNYKCPLSLQIMVNPVKSTVCVHAFERDSILEYMSRSGGARGSSSRPCPTQCSARLSQSTLIEDPAFTRACRNYARRLERRRERDRDRTVQQSTLLD